MVGRLRLRVRTRFRATYLNCPLGRATAELARIVGCPVPPALHGLTPVPADANRARPLAYAQALSAELQNPAYPSGSSLSPPSSTTRGTYACPLFLPFPRSGGSCLHVCWRKFRFYV